MFKCNKCGLSTKPYETQNRAVTSIREVEYLIQIKYERMRNTGEVSSVEANYKTVKHSKGKEIVKEEFHCNKCVSKKNIIPKVVGKVIRKTLVATKILRENDREAKGDKKNGRTRKDNQSVQQKNKRFDS